jgi:hypothetical protein
LIFAETKIFDVVLLHALESLIPVFVCDALRSISLKALKFIHNPIMSN